MSLEQQPVDRSFVPGIERPSAALKRGRVRRPTPMQLVVLALLVLASVIFTYPMVWLVASSLKAGHLVFTADLIPDPVMWSNYADLLEQASNFGNWFFNSVVVSGLSATTVTLSSAFVAFGFAYFRFPYRNLIFGIVLATMMLPTAVTMIPTFLIWQWLGQNVWPALGYNTLTPLWAGNLFASAFYIFMLRQFFLGLPRELFEAARVDGAGYIRMWRSVALPLTVPALIVVFVFELKASWTDLIKPLIFLRDVDLFTLPRGLLSIVASSSITGEGHFELLMAAAVLTTLPMVVLFFIAQRYFVEGIATTGRKG